MYARRKPLSLDTNLAGRLTVACLLVSALAQPALVRPAHAQQSCAFADTPEENPQGIPLQVTVGAGGPQELSGWDPSIVYDATLGKYRVWYTLFVSPVLGITYAESDDGILWQKDPDAPVHVVPPSEPWDAEGPETASVVRRDGTWYLWYTAKPCNRPPGELGRFKCIGLATSTDGGNTWVKHPVPVLEHSQAWEQPFQVEEPGPGGPVFSWEGGVQEPSVVWDAGEGLFKMWYEGHSQITLPPEPPGTEPITVPRGGPHCLDSSAAGLTGFMHERVAEGQLMSERA